jgi:beta-glucosidase
VRRRKRPFTGRLPVTWPRTLDLEPFNVGDEDYDPLCPFGWGLRRQPHPSRAG